MGHSAYRDGKTYSFANLTDHVLTDVCSALSWSIELSKFSTDRGQIMHRRYGAKPIARALAYDKTHGRKTLSDNPFLERLSPTYRRAEVEKQ